MYNVFPEIAGKEPLFSFLVGESNQEAHQAVMALMQEDPPLNHLILYGPAESGKSHLISQLRDYWMDHDRFVVCRSCDRFINEICRWLQQNLPLDAFYDIYEQKDVLILEDLQFIMKSETSKHYILEMIRRFMVQDKTVVLTGTLPKEDLDWLSELDFTWARIYKPDHDLKLRVIKEYESIAQTELSLSIRQGIAEFSSSIREIQWIFNRLCAFHDILHYPIDDHLLEIVLERAYRRIPS